MVKINFGQILELTKNRIDELDQDDQIDAIIKSAVNKAYADLSEVVKTFTTAYVPVINGMATMPDDLNKVIKISPALEDGEFVDDKTIFSDRNVTFTIVYSSIPEALVNNSDEPEIPEKYHYILSTYACYSYYLSKKRLDIAQVHLNDYQGEFAKSKNTLRAASPRTFINTYRE